MDLRAAARSASVWATVRQTRRLVYDPVVASRLQTTCCGLDEFAGWPVDAHPATSSANNPHAIACFMSLIVMRFDGRVLNASLHAPEFS